MNQRYLCGSPVLLPVYIRFCWRIHGALTKRFLRKHFHHKTFPLHKVFFRSILYKMLPLQHVSYHKTFPNITYKPQNASFTKCFHTKRFLTNDFHHKTYSSQNVFFTKCFLNNMFPATKRFLTLT